MPRSSKANITVVPLTNHPVIVHRDNWPDFPKPLKASKQSPFRTVLLFQDSPMTTVRVIVEGQLENSVEQYARQIIKP